MIAPASTPMGVALDTIFKNFVALVSFPTDSIAGSNALIFNAKVAFVESMVIALYPRKTAVRAPIVSRNCLTPSGVIDLVNEDIPSITGSTAGNNASPNSSPRSPIAMLKSFI